MLYINFTKIPCYINIIDTLIRKEGGLWRSGRTSGIRFWLISSGQPARWRSLRILSDRPMYGYELIQELKQRSGGKYQLSLLYPVLYRLEEQGYLTVSASEIVDGRARNYYAVTAAGREYLRQTLAEYDEISGVFRQLMEGWDG